MKISKELVARLEKMERVLPETFNFDVYVFCNEDDEAYYTIKRGPHKGNYDVFREDNESVDAFYERVNAEAIEKAQGDKVLVFTPEALHQLHVAFNPNYKPPIESDQSREYRRKMRKMTRARRARKAREEQNLSGQNF